MEEYAHKTVLQDFTVKTLQELAKAHAPRQSVHSEIPS